MNNKELIEKIAKLELALFMLLNGLRSSETISKSILDVVEQILTGKRIT